MYKKLILFASVLAAISTQAQTLSPQVQATAGDHAVSAAGSLSWTLGDVATETYTAGNNMITQGFHQPELTLTSIETKVEGIEVNIYPNPTAGSLNIVFTSTQSRKVEMQLFDMNGRLVSNRTESLQKGNQNMLLDLAPLAAAQYLLKVTDANSKKQSTYTIQKNN
jgi:hypothetical protein